VAVAKAGGGVPEHLAQVVQIVEYTVPDRNPDGELIAVATTICDPKQVSAAELAAAYQQRWEEESAIGEVKTHLRGRGEVLRSQSPAMVEQQMWDLLLAHYATRAMLVEAADEPGYDPDRTSFIRGLRLVRRPVTDQAAISLYDVESSGVCQESRSNSSAVVASSIATNDSCGKDSRSPRSTATA
jgi:hypothetical protein